MFRQYQGLCVFAAEADTQAQRAMEIFCAEIQQRTGDTPQTTDAAQADIQFVTDAAIENKDFYAISGAGTLTFRAKTIRGLLYAVGIFLRKTTYGAQGITLVQDIRGEFTPAKSIRGHQLGYRPTPNSYDAWDYAQYGRYYLDLLFFGANMVEHIPYEDKIPKRNRLMRYDAEDFLAEASRMADELDLDVSLWYPNYNNESIEEAVERRKNLFARVPRLNVVFPPGGDPGDYDADEFVARCRAISTALKEVHPKAEMWPSAQKPHTYVNWGPDFIAQMEQLPPEIDGVITGPNRAYDIDDLRRKLPGQYPIRLYPDITHNVRCEYPVHYDRNDWHYALATCLSRECINPRVQEYRWIHRTTRDYVVGSVSYSEGCSDDINKCVWTDMDVNPNVALRDSLLDYARLFFPGVPEERIADGIFALEQNWMCDPAENPQIAYTLSIWESLAEQFPALLQNWRFVQCLFRAQCDAFVRLRRLFETDLVAQATYALKCGDIDAANQALAASLPQTCTSLREQIEQNAALLFAQIGLQLDVERYGAENPERGATLETIDLPVSDRQWLQNRLAYAKTLPQAQQAAFLEGLLKRNQVGTDEYYFSVAEHGMNVLGVTQDGEYYMDFQGDRPKVNNGSIPMCMVKVYDHYTLRAKLAGFTGGDYRLRVSFKPHKYADYLKAFSVKANGHTIYEGKPFGGEKDPKFDQNYLAPGFETATYPLPAEVFVNGCVELEIGEKIAGVMVSEFWITKA